MMLFNYPGFSQASGKIISNAEADSIFGLPDFLLQMNTGLFSEFSRASDNKMRFGYDGQQLIITDENGNVLFPESYRLNEDFVLTVFDVSLLDDLIQLGQSDVLSFEDRPEHLTISNGSYTLQFGVPCPPYCE